MGIDTRSNDPYLQFYEADSSLLGLSLPQSWYPNISVITNILL
jgi:hypothetical protein